MRPCEPLISNLFITPTQLIDTPEFTPCDGSFRLMAVNTRFAIGTHVLLLLAAEPDKRHLSSDLATHLNTNPVVIRRVLASLQRAELVTSQRGPNGGSILAKKPKAISLAAVYEAVDQNPLFHTPDLSGNFAGKVNRELERLYGTARARVLLHLEGQSLAQVARQVRKPRRKAMAVA